VEEPLRILIVDDEPEARELLKFILQEKDDLEVVGMAASVDDAVLLMEKKHPDLVFLDIHMPGKDGFQFIEMVRQSPQDPGIIFVTAFDNYAIQAIRNSVFDYIMKPVRQDELMAAIGRFRTRQHTQKTDELSELIQVLRRHEHNKVKLNTRSGYVLVHPPDVLYCKADGNYTHLQMANGNHVLSSLNLGAMEELLKHESFFRVSRSYLINLRYLTKVDRKDCLCFLETPGENCSIKIPSQKVKLLETHFR
jgi:DNA-binding LytR/AlgR family response regulator